MTVTMRKSAWKGGLQLSTHTPIAHCQHLMGVQRAWVSIWAVKVIRTSSSPSVCFLLSWYIHWYTIPWVDLWETVPGIGWVNKNKLDKETTKQSHYRQSSFNHGGKVREVTDLDNRVRLSSANWSRLWRSQITSLTSEQQQQHVNEVFIMQWN